MKKTLLYLLIGVIFAGMGCTTYLAEKLIYPTRQPLPKTPEDYGMEYTELSLESSDGIELAGWFIPGTSNKLILFTHPMGFTRYGYIPNTEQSAAATDIEVEFLNVMARLNEAGYNILTFDFRNHGLSGQSEDGITGVGLFEWQDVAGVMEYINNDSTLSSMTPGIVANCMGANSVIIAMSKKPELFDDVKCLVAIQPVSTGIFTPAYTNAVYGPIIAWMLPSIEETSIKMGSPPWHDMSALPYAPDITCPVMVVQAASDPWIDVSFVQEVYDASPEPKEMVWLEGDLERFDAYNYFGIKPDKMLSFLAKYF